MKTSEKQLQYVKDWKERNKDKYKRVPLDLTTEDYAKLKQICDQHQTKVNTYIKQCIFGLNLDSILTAEEQNQLKQILQEQRNQTISDWLKQSIKQFITKHKEG